MKISKINSSFNFNSRYKQNFITKENNANFSQKSFVKIPLESWQAHTINNIQKINFQGNKKQQTNPIYIFLGPPLAGKGTTAKLMSQKKNIPIISVGGILRENIKKGTNLGKIVKEYTDKGELAPSDIVMNLIENRISEDDCKNGFIFDGFPRKVNEAKDFIEIVKRKNKEGKNYSIKVVNFVIDEKVLMDRANRRYLEEQRADDKPEIVKNRIRVYYENTKPVEELFDNMGVLTNIDTESKVGKETSQDCIFNKVLDSTENKK